MRLRSKVLIGSVVFIAIFVSFFYLPVRRFHIYKQGTRVPVANQFVQVLYSPICVSSPCGPGSLVFKGYTSKDGSIFLPLRDALKINHHSVIGGYDYSVIFSKDETYNKPIRQFDYIRLDDPMALLPLQDVSGTLFVTQVEHPDRPLVLDLGQEFFVPLFNTHSDYTFQLKAIDSTHQTADFVERLGDTNYPKPLRLQKGVPSYIPGEIADAQMVLDDLTPTQATLRFIRPGTVDHWNDREPLDFSYLFSPGNPKAKAPYQQALDYFASLSKNYPLIHGKPLPILPYDDLAGSVEAMGVLDSRKNICAHASFIPSDPDPSSQDNPYLIGCISRDPSQVYTPSQPEDPNDPFPVCQDPIAHSTACFDMIRSGVRIRHFYFTCPAGFYHGPDGCEDVRKGG